MLQDSFSLWTRHVALWLSGFGNHFIQCSLSSYNANSTEELFHSQSHILTHSCISSSCLSLISWFLGWASPLCSPCFALTFLLFLCQFGPFLFLCHSPSDSFFLSRSLSAMKLPGVLCVCLLLSFSLSLTSCLWVAFFLFLVWLSDCLSFPLDTTEALFFYDDCFFHSITPSLVPFFLSLSVWPDVFL